MAIVAISIIVVTSVISQANNNGEVFAYVSIVMMLIYAFIVIERKIDNYGKK
jgi:hypothetical protein